MKLRPIARLLVGALALGLWVSAGPTHGQTLLKHICRVKGQEESTLSGLGIVVGLEGTGDGGNFLPTIRSLSKAMELLGEPLSAAGLTELKDAKNVALVTVSATIPATGARQGDRLNCTVSSIGMAKSLAGGRLFLTPMVGPDRNDPRVYGFCEGAISLEDSAMARTGRIYGGCRLEADFFHAFAKDGKITLVLDRNHADFVVAQGVADEINDFMRYQTTEELVGSEAALAQAKDATNIEVHIPSNYREFVVEFLQQVLTVPITSPEPGGRVVINERSGEIVIGGNIEIGDAIVTHKNVVIETGSAVPRFVPFDPGETNKAKLDALVKTLNSVNVPTEDIIDIIRGLDRNGKLHAQLIIE